MSHGAFVSQRPPATPSELAPVPSSPAAPPSRAEVQRKLSVKLSGPNTRRPVKSHDNEPESSGPSSLPPLITSLIGGTQFSASPAASPASVHGPGLQGPHGPLSAIAERRGSSMDTREQVQDEVDEDDEASDDEGAAANPEGMDGERVFKSGFLIKKQERRKVWKKKWFVLRSTKLAYYKDNREYSLSRAIDLRQVHSVVPVTSEKQKHPFAFAVVTSDRNFMVEALSAEERDEWVRAINNVRKRMSEKEEEETKKQSQTRPMAVPAPQAPHPGDHLETDTHHGTWTSTFSNSTAMSGSPTTSTGGYFRQPGPSSWQPPPQMQGPPMSPSAGITTSFGNASLGRSPSTGAPPPSQASINRRLSNPIPMQIIPKVGGLRRNPSAERSIVGTGSSLSPPNQSTQFVSSDEDEPYFSDPNAAWPAEQSHQQEATTSHPGPPDPNQVVLGMYLMKKSRKTTREVWRKRWFYLTSAGVTYTKSHMDSRPLTFIPMSSILDVFSVDPEEIDDDEGSSGPEARSRSPAGRHQSRRKEAGHDHLVRIVCAKRRYDLCAPSEEDEIKWIAAIRAMVNREREKQKPSGREAPSVTPANVPIITGQPPTPGVSTTLPSPAPLQANADSPIAATPRRTATQTR